MFNSNICSYCRPKRDCEDSWSSDLLLTFPLMCSSGLDPVQLNYELCNSIINKGLQLQDNKSLQSINPAQMLLYVCVCVCAGATQSKNKEQKQTLILASGWVFTPPSRQLINPLCHARPFARQHRLKSARHNNTKFILWRRSRFAPPILRLISISLILLFEPANPRMNAVCSLHSPALRPASLQASQQSILIYC